MKKKHLQKPDDARIKEPKQCNFNFQMHSAYTTHTCTCISLDETLNKTLLFKI